MSKVRIRRLWLLEYYDYDWINTYLNNRADQGEALEYIGGVFAIYKKTIPGEYEYKVDYIENYTVDSEEFEQYKNTWTSKGWEYVDFFDGMVIFRGKKKHGVLPVPIDLETIRAAIFNRLKKQGKSAWLQAIVWAVILALDLMVMEYKIGFAMILTIQLLQFDSLLSYLNLKKRCKNGFSYQIDQVVANKCILMHKVIRCIRKILTNVFMILLFYMFVFYYHSPFFAKCMVLLLTFSILYEIYLFFKLRSKRQEKKFNMDSKKGKFLFASMFIIVITAVMLSFVWIDRLQPKWDVLKECPPMILECNNKSYDVEYDYGKWNYAISNGISTGYEEGFRLPKSEDIILFDRGDDDTIEISMVKKPDKMEVRYWRKSDFNKLKSYDKGYQEIPIQNGTFTAVDKDVVYVVYAEWEREHYDGIGYYVFTLKGE